MAAEREAQLWDVIVSPRITEKGTEMSVQHKYVFNVRPEANKLEIKAAVEQAFDVDVVAVNTINMKGKVRRWGRTLGRTAAWKKAIVTLEEGQTIDVFEG
ncbi:MAG: 50S ribosomal protein L23 [Chloroflexota bacterium]|nr:50S ribosomal protein L23 [Chloroflexota bacterium]